MRLHLFALGVLVLFPARALAAPAEDVAAAEALFREARALVEKGNAADACPKFAESQRLDPAPGTLLNLGDCYERTHRVASAWAAYREAAFEARRLGQLERVHDAEALARELESTVPKLTIDVPPDHEVAGLVVTRNGREIPRAQWRVPLPTDPGVQEIVARAHGRRPWTARVEVGGVRLAASVRVPALEIAPAAPPPAGATGDVTASDGQGQRTLGLVVGAAGLALAAGGAATGLLALDLDGRARRAGCDDDVCWTARGRSLTEDARAWAAVSTVSFIAGAAGTTAGVVIFVSAPRVSNGRAASIVVSGAF